MLLVTSPNKEGRDKGSHLKLSDLWPCVGCTGMPEKRQGHVSVVSNALTINMTATKVVSTEWSSQVVRRKGFSGGGSRLPVIGSAWAM